METHTEHRSIKVLAFLGAFLTCLGILVYLTATTARMESIRGWTETTTYPFDVAPRNAVVHDGRIYVFGGIVDPRNPPQDPVIATNQVKVAAINADGSIGGWNNTTPLPKPMYNHAVAANDTHVYLVGGWDTSTQTILRDVYRAPFLPGGGLGTWQPLRYYTGAGSTGITLHALEVIGNRLYVFGGWDGTGPLDQVYYAPINANGIGDWQEDSVLPVEIARSDTAQTSRHVYLIGGGYSRGQDNPSVQYDQIYAARINANGSLGTWQLLERRLPTGPLYYHQAVIHDDRLVILGGRNNDEILNDVWSSAIASNGTLGEWAEEIALGQDLYRFAAVSVKLYASDYIFAVGGLSNTSPIVKTVYHSTVPPTPTPTPTPGIGAFLDNTPGEWLAPGDEVTYEITLSGNDVADFDDVRVTNSIPSQTELLANSITAGDSTAYTITRSTQGSEIEWYYSEFSRDSIDQISYRVRRLPPSPPDVPVTLSIDKSGPATAEANAPIQYTLVVTNNTDIQLIDIVVEDEMPLGATYVSGGDGPPIDGRVVRWTIDVMAPQERRELQFTVTATHTLVNSRYRVRTEDGGNILGHTVVVTKIGDTNPPPNGDGVAIVNHGAIVEWLVNGLEDQNQSNSIRNPMSDFFVPIAPKQ